MVTGSAAVEVVGAAVPAVPAVEVVGAAVSAAPAVEAVEGIGAGVAGVK